jgi:hypothetical protein
MNYDLNNLTSKADCDLVLKPLGHERDSVAIRQSTLALQLENFGNPEAMKAEITRLNNRITSDEADLLLMQPGKDQREKENEIARSKVRRNQLVEQSEKQGKDDQVMKQLELACAGNKLNEVNTLISLVQARKDSLPN